MNNKRGLWLVVFTVAFALSATIVQAAKVGQLLTNVMLKDAEKNPVKIPDFGKKVLMIIYADSTTADVNDPVADAVRDKKFDESKYEGLGIANLKDSWAPNALIRMVIRKKIKQYNKTILTDDNRILPTKWGLGDCNDVSVVLIVGKDKRLKYIKKGEVKGAEIDKVVKILETEINKH